MRLAIIPAGLKGKELYAFAVKNESLIIHTKKQELKKADGLVTSNYFVNEKGAIVSKAYGDRPEIPDTAGKLNLDVVINTTNYFDSHWDVHIPGLWTKSLNDNRKNGFYLLETHGRRFQDVIGDSMAGSANKMAWRDLGYEYPGITEALMFSGQIEKTRNPYMFEQYAKGRVKQHSVGMQYVKMVTCINDEDYPVQKENWDKYISQVVNPEAAEEEGIFWAILEAKISEGSAVLFGSNGLTPTYNVEEAKGTQTEPVITTQEQPSKSQFDVSGYINNLKFFN